MSRSIDVELLKKQEEELLNETLSDYDEDFRCFNATPPSEVENVNRKTEDVDPPNANLDAKMLHDQLDLLQSSESSENEDFRCSIRSPSPTRNPLIEMYDCEKLITIKHSRTNDEDFRCSNRSPSPTQSPLIEMYDREKLITIKHSRTNDDWLSYLWLNHGRDWAVDELPFQLDPELRCHYGRQLNVRRERDDLAHNTGSCVVGHSKKKNKKKKSKVKALMNGSSGIGVVQTDRLPSFTDKQTNVWIKYLSYINSRIKEIAGGE
ncbi:hypothetical protein GPALN_005421 [Globodera pallida]|nr:hypothetical protein GPALN_005421 [Globodera pallida]